MLKPAVRGAVAYAWYQPPSGGCVLKQGGDVVLRVRLSQPPSGGCVLKFCVHVVGYGILLPAAFGRLCVETVKAALNALAVPSRLRAAVC